MFGTQASETASHSSQSERLFLSRIATGRPWPLAKNRTLGRPTRRPSDAVAGATPPIFIDGISQRGPGQGTPPRARVDIRREHPPAGFGVGAQTKSDESGSTDSAMCLESTALDAVPVLGKPLLLLPTAPHGCGPPKRRTLQYHRARARGRERIHNGSSLASTLASTFNVCPPATRDAIDAEKIDRWLSRTSATPPAIRPPYRP